MKKQLKYAMLSMVCALAFLSNPAQAKTAEPDLRSAEADYYIIEDVTAGKPGKVSAKLQNQEAVITIPETVEIEGKKYTVTGITGLCYPDTLDASLKQDAYKCKKNKKTTRIVLPKTIKTIQKGTFTNFTKLKTIEIDPDNTKFKVVKGSVLSKNGKTLYGTITLKGTYTVPKGVKTIASRAFAYSGVSKVVLSKECRTIKERAFYRCTNLKTIKRIKNVKKVEAGAFYKTRVKGVTKDGKLKK